MTAQDPRRVDVDHPPRSVGAVGPSSGTTSEGEVGVVPGPPRAIAFEVYGQPVPQGSVRSLGAGRPSIHANAARLKPWRSAVADATREALDRGGFTTQPFGWRAPLRVSVTFTFPRPAYHYGTGRNSHELKANAPRFPVGRPDVDRLARGLLDAIDGLMYADDSQVVALVADKRYVARDVSPGAQVVVSVAT